MCILEYRRKPYYKAFRYYMHIKKREKREKRKGYPLPKINLINYRVQNIGFNLNFKFNLTKIIKNL